MTVTTSVVHCHRLALVASVASSQAQVPTSTTPQLPRLQTLFPATAWTRSSSPVLLPPPQQQSVISLPTLFDANRCRSPPTFPYRKCMLDVCITPTKTTLRCLELPLTKPRKPLSLFDLLSVDAALSSVSPSDATTSQQQQQQPQQEQPALGRSATHRRQCGVPECAKYALSGGFCIRHGGGKRCNFAGCLTVAQSGGLCKAHGGGSKCRVADCGSVARRKGFCMSHGGRQPCKVTGCTKCAHGGGYCISHGGGKRCSALDCIKSAQAGGFCYSHGGGKRCSAPQCFQAARKGGLCIRHRKAGA